MPRGAFWTLLFVAITLVLVPGTMVAQEETAWEALVRENPSVADEGVTPRLERQILQRLTPEQAEGFAAGQDPSTIVLADGRDLGTALPELLTAPGGVYHPVDACKLRGPGVPAGDLYPVGDTVVTVRGTCGVPPEATGLVVNLKMFGPTEAGRISVFPAEGGVFGPGFLNFKPTWPCNNSTVVELCDGTCAAGDLVVRMSNVAAPQRVLLHALGYFAPEGDADPSNELNTSVELIGTTLEVTDAGGVQAADLGSLVDDADADPANEVNIAVGLVGTQLQVTDAGGTLGAELGGSFATDAELLAHAGNVSNPHLVTWEQVEPAMLRGDLLVGVELEGVSTLAAGADGQVLVADSTQSTGLKWVEVGVGSAYPAPVPRTGQTLTYGLRDDGELQAGVPWPDPRFSAPGDGTVTDNLTGLIWLADASCVVPDLVPWEEALAAANGLADGDCGLTDGSIEGDWRLPSVRELQSLIHYGEYDPALPIPHPFSGVQLDFYWSSTTYAPDPGDTWAVGVHRGSVQRAIKHGYFDVWPVRGGQ